MDPAIAQRLEQLNARFYEDFAEDFAASRTRINAGIERVLGAMVPLGTLVDLGCGSARVGHAWAEGRFPGPVRYVGVDRSVALLGTRPPGEGMQLVDLAIGEEGWAQALRARVAGAGFDHAVSFATLHHLPMRSRRVDALREIGSLLRPGGGWAISVWQFLHVERLRARVVDWGEVGLRPDALEHGDLLVDWRRGGRGLRYVHHYDPDELLADCAAAGLEVTERFASDGATGDLGLYLRGR